MVLRVLKELFPHVHAYSANRKIQRRVEALERAEHMFEVPLGQPISEADVARFRADFDADVTRRHRIVDRGRSALLVVGLTSGLATTAVKFILDAQLAPLPIGILSLALFYLALSAWSVTTAVNVQRRYGIFLDDLVNVTEPETKATETHTISIVKMSNKYEVEELYYLGKMNQLATLKISNHVSAGFSGIRNAIAALFVFFLLVAWKPSWDSALPKSPPEAVDVEGPGGSPTETENPSSVRSD